MSRIFCAAVVLLIFGLINHGSTQNGKLFEFILDRFEVLEETPSIIEWVLRVKKVNKTRCLVGYVMYHEPIGNNFKFGAKMLKKQGGEYRYTPYSVLPGPLCDTLGKDKYIYPDVVKNSDFPGDIAESCPVPAGNYSLHSVSFNLEFVPQSVANTGEYAGEVYYFKGNQQIAIYRIYGYINNV